MGYFIPPWDEQCKVLATCTLEDALVPIKIQVLHVFILTVQWAVDNVGGKPNSHPLLEHAEKLNKNAEKITSLLCSLSPHTQLPDWPAHTLCPEGSSRCTETQAGCFLWAGERVSGTDTWWEDHCWWWQELHLLKLKDEKALRLESFL